MKERKALMLALEALETYKGFIDDAHIIEGQWHWIDGLDNVQTAIKEALAPPVPETHKRKPLTEEQIIEATEHIDTSCHGYFVHITRAIEFAHGIKE